jgi:hypothetical protein
MKTRYFPVFLLVLAGALPLAGCATPAQRDAANEASCAKWGAQPGTALYVECMTTLRGVDASVAAADAQRMIAAGVALQGAGRALRGPDSINCTSIRTGQVTNTNCQ